MKLSILTLLAAAMLATASVVPCERHDTSDATELGVSDVAVFTTHEVCRSPCTRKRHKCPKGWYIKKMTVAKCWACCKKIRPHIVEFDLEDEGLDEFEELYN